MYVLKTYFPPSFDVKPFDGMYTLPSYHQGEFQAPTTSNGVALGPEAQFVHQTFSETDFVQQQAHLIKELLLLKENFEKLTIKLAGEGIVAGRKRSTSFKAEPSPVAVKQPTKQAATEVPKKVGVVEGARPFEVIPLPKDNAYVPREDTKISNDVCMPPVLIKFKAQKGNAVGKIEISKPDDCGDWLNLLETLAKKNGLAFDVVRSGKSSVYLAKTETVTAEGLIASWKMLGASIGLYSYESSVVTNTIDKWLDLFEGKSSGEDAKIWRSANQYLSSNPTLTGTNEFGLSDVIAYSFYVKSTQSHESNLEIWAGRFSQLL
uniref:Polyprotein n=1 Tax=Rhabditophanes sp. KR3021 TaxID=114890 RepID=A0AC35TG99_9BILA